MGHARSSPRSFARGRVRAEMIGPGLRRARTRTAKPRRSDAANESPAAPATGFRDPVLSSCQVVSTNRATERINNYCVMLR